MSAPDTPLTEDALRRIIGEELDRRLERLAPPSELLTREQLVALLGISDRTLARLLHERAVPLPAKLGGRIERWRRDAIDRWLDSGAPPFRSRPKAGSVCHGDRRS